MCGICCYIGFDNGFQHVYDGITLLLNRGYDSGGLCSISKDNKFIVHKYASTHFQSAIKLLEKHKNDHDYARICMAHTRWSTSSAVTDNNSHPHLDQNGLFSVVHNGIIENYDTLKNELINKYNVKFSSETDSEIIAQLISVYYNKVKDTKLAIKKALNRLEGTWGIVVMTLLEPTKIHCARRGSPLLIGFGENSNFMMISSEQAGFCNHVKNYITLNDHDIVVLIKDDIHKKIIFDKKSDYETRDITIESSVLTPYPYPYSHWMIREIHEQQESSLRALSMGARILNNCEVKLGGLVQYKDQIKNLDNIIVLGCGSSYNSATYSANIFKSISGLNTVQVFDGAEFTENDIPKNSNTGLILISQSGETKDLHRALELAKEKSLLTLGVINVVDSLIARSVNAGVYMNCGREVSVASTKSYCSSIIILHLIAIYIAQLKNINNIKRSSVIDCLRKVSHDIRQVIDDNKDIVKNIVQFLVDKKNLFILGRHNCEAVAKEGALKIKEIDYIHAEGFSSASLKHGTIALIEKDVPVIMITPNNNDFVKNQCSADEVLCRGAVLIGISDIELDTKKYKFQIKIPKNEHLFGMLAVIPLQLLAYEIALLKGHNPDIPRNLAKVVTVD